jgi:hypothetical protein
MIEKTEKLYSHIQAQGISSAGYSQVASKMKILISLALRSFVKLLLLLNWHCGALGTSDLSPCLMYQDFCLEFQHVLQVFLILDQVSLQAC